MPTLSALILDFDGVLSKGRFYSGFKETNPALFELITQKVFSKDNWDNIAPWMRGEIDYKEFNKRISKILNVDSELLNDELVKSVKAMELNSDIFNLSQELRMKGLKIAILTDNMDVFTDIFVPHNSLDSKFDFIYSSNKFGKHKRDNTAELMKLAVKNFNVPTEKILYIDDGEKNVEAMQELGPYSYLYKDYENNFKDLLNFIETTFKLEPPHNS